MERCGNGGKCGQVDKVLWEDEELPSVTSPCSMLSLPRVGRCVCPAGVKPCWHSRVSAGTPRQSGGVHMLQSKLAVEGPQGSKARHRVDFGRFSAEARTEI